MTKKIEADPETWLEDYGDYLYRFAYVRLGNKASAEDAVQETFLAALKAQDRYDGRVDIKYWLLGILKHKVVDHIRKAARETSVEDVEMLPRDEKFRLNAFGITTSKPAPWQFNPRKVFEQKEFREVLSICVSRLQGKMREVFTLRELEGWSTEEICKELNIRPNHIWVIIHRARSQLKTCLEENWKRLHEPS